MILAVADGGISRQPQRSGEPGTCPHCAGPVRGKRGPIVIAHWAHLAADGGCDPWAAGESDWHRAWKAWYARRGARIEVTIDHGRQRHRADVICGDGRIVELQHGYLPVAQITAREAFYGPRLVWIYDAREWDGRLHRGRPLGGGWRGLWFKNGGKSLVAHAAPVWLDLGDRMARLTGLGVSDDGSRLLGRIRVCPHPWAPAGPHVTTGRRTA
jgi:hypothetical protein